MKFLFRLFLFFVVSAAVVLTSLYFLFSTAKIQTLVENQLEQRLHREVRLKGIHPAWSGLRIDHLELSEEPNFRGGTFLAADHVKLLWSLGLLLRSLHWGSCLPSQLDGKLWIQKATTPFYEAQRLTVSWHLIDVDPTLSRLNGWVKLRQGPALVKNMNRLASKEKTLAIVLLPLQLLQNLDQLGVLQLGLPNLEHWPLTDIDGDYRFTQGVMTIDRFHLDSKDLQMSVAGDVELVSHRLKLILTLHMPPQPSRGALDVQANLTGTLEHPRADLESFKKEAFKATITNILGHSKSRNDLQKQLQKIFH